MKAQGVINNEADRNKEMTRIENRTSIDGNDQSLRSTEHFFHRLCALRKWCGVLNGLPCLSDS